MREYSKVIRTRNKESFLTMKLEAFKKMYNGPAAKRLFELERQGKIHVCLSESLKYYFEYPEDSSIKCLIANCYRKLGDYENARIFLDRTLFDVEYTNSRIEYV